MTMAGPDSLLIPKLTSGGRSTTPARSSTAAARAFCDAETSQTTRRCGPWRSSATGSEADVIGAGTDLSAEPETWSALLDLIEAERDALQPDRVRTLLNELGVLHPINHRPIIGKAGAEIEADAAHFQELSRRASVLAGAV